MLCPILLMLVLVYARSMIDPRTNDDFSLYSIRRPFYPIAKAEMGDRFTVSMPDQQRQLDNYREFFTYLDATNINVTVPVNVTETAQIVAEFTGVPNVIELVGNVKNDIRVLANLTRLLEQTPIANFSKKIAWGSFEKLLISLGLDGTINLAEIKAAAEEFEATISNPELLLQDLTGFNITAAVEAAID